MSLITRDAMTPTNESQANSTRFLENTSLKNKNSNSTLTDMPSPPLSPYTRNNYDDNDTIPALLFPRASKPLTSDLRYLELISSNSIPNSNSNSNSKTVSINSKSSSDNTKTVKPLSVSNSNTISIEKSTKDNKNDNNNNNITNLNENSILHIDPYKYLNKKGYKKCQLDFLSQYQFKNLSSFNSNSYIYSNNINNNNHNHNLINKRQRSTIRHSYDSLKSNDNSNSDSELERPRTRRIVRQNNLELEIDENSNYDSSSISRPSTPIKRKSNNNSSLSTPKRQRNSTPIVYNYDYKKIEDFCPSLDTLPSNNKCLKTDWKGQSMDLSNDPLIHELHPAEVVLASILRLPCAVYLDSKRRIFQEKVKRMKYNLPFRRTDAQKSCKIDVNKASRLFAAFEKVGWFNESHFQKYL